MYVYHYCSLGSLVTPARAEEWLKKNRLHYQIGPGRGKAYSFEAVLNEISLDERVVRGPLFIIKAKITKDRLELICRGQRIKGDVAYIATVDALRNVRIVQEFPIE
jgi:hypothetical protein